MTIQQAATEIVALINSKPFSPSKAEIAAILGRIRANAPQTPMSPAHAEHYREWRGLIGDHLREFGSDCEAGMTDAEIEAMEEPMAAHAEIIEALAQRILATPAQAWGDVLLYAEVCFWYRWPGADPQGPEASFLLQGAPCTPWCTEGMCDVALVKLLKAIFTVAGLGHFANVRAR